MWIVALLWYDCSNFFNRSIGWKNYYRLKLRIHGYVTRLFGNWASLRITGPINFCDWLHPRDPSFRSDNCKEKDDLEVWHPKTANPGFHKLFGQEGHHNGWVPIDFHFLVFYNMQPKHATWVFLHSAPISPVQKCIPFWFLGAARSCMGPPLNRETEEPPKFCAVPKMTIIQPARTGALFSSGCQVFELYSQNLGHNLCSYALHTKIILEMKFTASLLLSAGGQFLSHS